MHKLCARRWTCQDNVTGNVVLQRPFSSLLLPSSRRPKRMAMCAKAEPNVSDALHQIQDGLAAPPSAAPPAGSTKQGEAPGTPSQQASHQSTASDAAVDPDHAPAKQMSSQAGRHAAQSGTTGDSHFDVDAAFGAAHGTQQAVNRSDRPLAQHAPSSTGHNRALCAPANVHTPLAICAGSETGPAASGKKWRGAAASAPARSKKPRPSKVVIKLGCITGDSIDCNLHQECGARHSSSADSIVSHGAVIRTESQATPQQGSKAAKKQRVHSRPRQRPSSKRSVDSGVHGAHAQADQAHAHHTEPCSSAQQVPKSVRQDRDMINTMNVSRRTSSRRAFAQTQLDFSPSLVYIGAYRVQP